MYNVGINHKWLHNYSVQNRTVYYSLHTTEHADAAPTIIVSKLIKTMVYQD